MQKSMQWIDRDRLSVFTGAILLALALSRLLDTPVRPVFASTVFGSPLSFNLSATVIMQLIILGMMITGMTSLIQSHPLVGGDQRNQRFIFWIIPGLLGMGLASWLNRLGDLGIWTAVLLVCFVLIPFALTVEYNAIDPATRRTAWLRWAQLALVHITAVLLFTLIYQARWRSLLSGTAVVLISSLLAIRLFWGLHNHVIRAARHSMVVGFSMGQMTWILNYWRLSDLQGGLLLFLLFYVLTGLIQQTMTGYWGDGQNGRRVLLEYGGVAIAALLFVILVVP